MWPIIGHHRAVDLLRRSIASGRISHAYLFQGPPQVGKTSLAKAFAQALNCSGRESPCGECRSCKAIDNGVHPDVRTIQIAASDHDDELADDGEASQPGKGSRRVITIGQIRSLQRDAALLPYEGRWKVYIIRNAENLNAEAANCLLKTLEEPPPSVVLILTTVDAKILPVTIVSRCQQLALGLLPLEEVRRALQEKWELDADKANLLAHLSGGRLGWAIDAASRTEALEERLAGLARIDGLSESDKVERFKYAEETAATFGRNPDAVYSSLDLWLSWWRDILLVRSGCPELVTNVGSIARLSVQANRYEIGQLCSFLSGVELARIQLQQNVNARLAIEVMLLGMPQPVR